ncbi:hypothetical protein LTR50_007719 [Elasticomyces elasticus]|nr:hypothetical protein LTR50_007719 [Elasticomyces elasticus]
MYNYAAVPYPESKTGSFSFWLGKNLVVGVSGEAARKTILEHKAMDHLKAIYLVGLGPDGIDGIKSHLHAIWDTPGGNKSYAQKKTLGCQKTTELIKRIPGLTTETRKTFEEAGKPGASYVSPVFLCAELTWTHSTRVFTTDELVDDPVNRAMLLKYMPMLLFCPSPHLICFPWASYLSPSYWVRKYGRRGFRRMITPVVENRMSGKTKRTDDPLQTFIDNGDSADYIINFMISMIFVAGANGSGVAGSMLYCIAHHLDIQERIFEEIKAIANANCADKSAPLVD